MHTVIPSYYGAFRCLAGDCRHNCCIGWEIDIDPDTYACYQTVGGAFGDRLRAGIAHGPCFRLDAQERCVFLNENGLCDIILTLGEDALCDICTDHPRFRTYIGDEERLGLGLCCEAACRLVLGHPVSFQDADTGEKAVVNTAVSPPSDTRTPAGWADVYRALERLDPCWDRYLDTLAACETFAVQRDAVWERLTAYFMFRHDHAPFAAHAVSIIQTIGTAVGADFEELCEICRLYSAEIEYSDENLTIVKTKTAES